MPLLIDEETEAQRGEVPWLGLYQVQVGTAHCMTGQYTELLG